jgi:excisionase family DNA binding protein
MTVSKPPEHGRRHAARRADDWQPVAPSRPRDDRYLTVPEVAAWLNVTPKTVYRYVACDGLPCTRLRNRTLRFQPSRVQAWLDTRTDAIEPASDLDRVLEQVAPTLLRLPPRRRGPSA